VSFSKLHYQQFADMLGEIKDAAAREFITTKCSEIFKADNPRFSDDIFQEWINRRLEGKTIKGLRPNPKYTHY
jgi:hypothetical protein